MRIQEVEVASFRGFKERCRFDFQGVDLLVLYGPNGHGKSSFFDALEWSLTGAINRYDESSDERKRSRFVGNRFSTEAPQVVLKLLDAGGNLIRIIRTGTASSTSQTDYGASELVLEIDGEPSLHGDAAERRLGQLLVSEAWQDKVDINRGLSLTHLLGQERMNYFLRGMSGNERYDSLSLLFGTEQFYRYRETLKTLQRDLESKRDELTGEYSGLRRQWTQGQEKIAEMLEEWPDLEETPGQLQQALFEYMGLFMPIEPDMTPEGIWLLIKQHQEELMSEKVRFELGVQRELRMAYQLLPKWQEAQAVCQTERERVVQLERLCGLKSKHKEVEWMLERIELFQQGSERRTQILQEFQEVNEQGEKLRHDSSHLNQFIALIDDSLDEAMDHGDFDLVLEQVRSASVDETIRENLLDRISTLGPLYKSNQESKTAAEDAGDAVAALEKSYDQLLVIDQKYRNLLGSVEEYLSMHDDVDACPACGTTGVTSSHLLTHIRTEQGVLNPQLPLIGKSLMEAKQKWQDKQEQAQEMFRQYEAAVAQIDLDLSSLEQRAEEQLAESHRLQTQASLLHNEIDQLDQVLFEFKGLVAKLLPDVEEDDLPRQMNLLKEYLVLDMERASAGFSVAELLDVDQTLAEQRRKLNSLEEGQSAFLQHMAALQYVQEDGREWTAEQVEELLADALQQQRDWLETHEQKEKISLKVLSILSRHERYQELQMQKQRAEVLLQDVEQVKAERERVEADLEIVKEVYKKVPEAVDRLNEKVIAELFGTIQSIFERINSHPLYRTLDFEKGQRFGSNRLQLRVLPKHGEEGGSSANPSFIFSAAQVNSIALSFFLAMALQQQWSPLRLIAMDDPVQSMDDLNVLALIDLMRSMCESRELGRQVMISTHDRTFYQMMLKKFRFLQVGVIEYEGYGADGPVIKQQVDPLGQSHYVQRNTPVTMKELGNEFLR